jgi:hypothetical protein
MQALKRLDSQPAALRFWPRVHAGVPEIMLSAASPALDGRSAFGRKEPAEKKAVGS